MNRVIQLGRIAGDIELRHTVSGKAVVSFGLAVRKSRDESIFLDCVAWEKTAEFIAQYLSKGRQIVVDGHLDVRRYQDKQGNHRKAVEIIVDRVYFADSGGVRSEAAAPPEDCRPAATPAPAGDFEAVPFEMDDSNLPF